MNHKCKILGFYNYTVILTYIGMIFGMLGLVLALKEQFHSSILCLMLAGICDMFDGTIANTKIRTQREKAFGIQIDSLSDLICFGVFPAVFVYMLCAQSSAALFAALLYTLCALIRLAYFNVLESERQSAESGSRKFYQGLPVTSIALMLPLVYIFASADHTYLLTIIMTAVLFLMPFKIRKPYKTGRAVIAIVGLAEISIIILGAV